MFLNLSDFTQEERPWLVLLTETWLQTSIEVDGKEMTLAEVTKQRSKDALTFYNDLGYKGSTFTPGSQSENMMFYCECMLEKYEQSVNLLKTALFNVKFTLERTQTILSMLLNSLPNAKINASAIAKVMSDNMYFNNKTIIYYASFLRQNKFLIQVQKQLESNPEEVLNKLQSLAKKLVQPKNAFVYLATDLSKLTDHHQEKAASVWKDFFPSDMEFDSQEELQKRFATPSENEFVNENPEIRHSIAGKSLD